MQDYLGDVIKAGHNFLAEAFKNKWFWYAIIVLIVFFIVMLFQKDLFNPVDLFS